MVTTSVPKITVKSNLRGEIARWVQALRLNVEYYSKDKRSQPPPNGNNGDQGADARSTKSSITPSASVGAPGSRGISATLNELPPSDQFLHPGLKRTPTTLSGISSKSKTKNRDSALPPVPPIPERARSYTASSSRKRNNSPGGNTTASDKDSDRDTDDGMRDPESVPHESEFELSMLNLTAQLELTQQLVGSIVTPPGTPDSSGRAGTSSPSRQRQVKDALRESIATLNHLVQRQYTMSQDRERYFSSRIRREVQARKLWEENLLAVAEQQAETDRQLTEAAKDNEKKRRALRQARSALAELSISQPGSPGLDGQEPAVPPQNIMGGPITSPPPPQSPPTDFAPVLTLPPSHSPASAVNPALRQSLSRRSMSTNRASISLGRRGSISQYNRNSLSRQSISLQDIDHVVAAAIDDSEDDDDEFFDAIETGTIPNLKTYDTINNPQVPGSRPGTPIQTPADEVKASPLGQVVAVRQAKKGTVESYLSRKSLEPYNHVRHRLPIDDDKRPSVSLWSILKSSIGKDLTKISFPVSFNECTSMLQRMGECLERDRVRLTRSGGHGIRRLPDCRCERAGRSKAYRVRGCVRHVELFVDIGSYRQTVQPYALPEFRVRHPESIPLHL